MDMHSMAAASRTLQRSSKPRRSLGFFSVDTSNCEDEHPFAYPRFRGLLSVRHFFEEKVLNRSTGELEAQVLAKSVATLSKARSVLESRPPIGLQVLFGVVLGGAVSFALASLAAPIAVKVVVVAALAGSIISIFWLISMHRRLEAALVLLHSLEQQRV